MLYATMDTNNKKLSLFININLHDDTERHVHNIFNMALKKYDSHYLNRNNNWDYGRAIANFFNADINNIYIGDITKLMAVERYLLIKQCKKNYCNKKNIKLNFNDMFEMFFNDDDDWDKLRYNVIIINKQLCKHLMQEKNTLTNKLAKSKQKYKSLKEHVLAQPDGELYFEAKKDWDSKTKKTE